MDSNEPTPGASLFENVVPDIMGHIHCPKDNTCINVVKECHCGMSMKQLLF